MRLVKRQDGMMLNLGAVLFFTPQKDNMVVEMPGEQFFIIYNFEYYDLNTNTNTFHKEFGGWPKCD